jgi:hypothetical protein
MTRTLVSNAIAALLALLLFAAPAAAVPETQAVFTDFEDISPNTIPMEIITVGASPDSADLGGNAFGGAIGAGALYHTCCKAWMVLAPGTGLITFETDAEVVEFYARVIGIGTLDTVITAFDQFGVIVGAPKTVFTRTGWQLISFSGAIAKIEVENLDGTQLNGIDDFGFTPLPEPGAVLTLASGSALLGLIGRRRYAR